MKTLILVALLLPVVAFAQDDVLLFFTGDPALPDASPQTYTTGPFEWVTIHVGIRNPSLGGVSGYEFAVWTEGDSVGANWSMAGCGEVSIPECNVPPFQHGLPDALSPTPLGYVHLGTWTGLVQWTSDVVRFFLGPVPGSTTFPDSPGYAGPAPESGSAPLTTIQGGDDLPVFSINQVTVSAEARSWSAVKILYR